MFETLFYSSESVYFSSMRLSIVEFVFSTPDSERKERVPDFPRIKISERSVYISRDS